MKRKIDLFSITETGFSYRLVEREAIVDVDCSMVHTIVHFHVCQGPLKADEAYTGQAGPVVAAACEGQVSRVYKHKGEDIFFLAL